MPSRVKFDSLLEEVINALPPEIRKQLDEVPVVVEDEPSNEVLRDMDLDPNDRPSDLCGVHQGIPLPDRAPTSDAVTLPSVILIFRGPILRMVEEENLDLREQIEITLLHEIAHHFGFTEEELDDRGYG